MKVKNNSYGYHLIWRHFVWILRDFYATLFSINCAGPKWFIRKKQWKRSNWPVSQLSKSLLIVENGQKQSTWWPGHCVRIQLVPPVPVCHHPSSLSIIITNLTELVRTVELAHGLPSRTVTVAALDRFQNDNQIVRLLLRFIWDVVCLFAERDPLIFEIRSPPPPV